MVVSLKEGWEVQVVLGPDGAVKVKVEILE